MVLAGLLCPGGGLGLAAALLVRLATGSAGAASGRRLIIPRRDIPWLAGAIGTGGVLGPALAMAGLTMRTGTHR